MLENAGHEMSESDDTEILLLIPPNYFNLKEEQLNTGFVDDDLKFCETMDDQDFVDRNDALTMPPPSTYHFLDAHRKAELKAINAKLNNMEILDDKFASDISTISNVTVQQRGKRDGIGLVHSTPKGFKTAERDVLNEIDNFLGEQQTASNWNTKHHSDGFQDRRLSDNRLDMLEAKSLPHLNCKPSPSACTPNIENLISLSEIWGSKNGQTAIAGAGESSVLKEEQLRRQHLEKTVRSLQSRLLEYQQRLSVAIEVDKAKDTALSKAQIENKKYLVILY